MILVNSIEIAEDAVLKEMQYHPAEEQRAAELKAAESLIIGELLKQRANELNIATDDDANYLDDLLKHEVEIPGASEDECQTYYEHNKAKFCSAPLLAVRHILLAADPENIDETDQAKSTAQQIIETLKGNPKAFPDLVARYSRCPSKKEGGNLGQIVKGQTVPEFEKVLFKSNKGLIDYPVKSRYGYHVVIIEEKIDGEQLPFELVYEKIRDYLNEKVRRKAIAQYIQTLIGDAKIDGYDFNLSSSPLMQ